MKSTVLFTGWDEPYAKLAKITWPRMAQWAHRHDIDFQVYTEPPAGLNIFWTGVARALELLRDGYNRIIYLDVDQFITNPERRPMCDPDYGFWASKDWGKDAIEPWHFSACGWIAHADCIPMFEEVLAMAPEWMDKPFQEQGPWQAWMKKKLEHLKGQLREGKPGDPPAFINIMPRRFLNSVPDEVCPGEVPDPWQRGDFAAHLTMLPMDERLKLAKKFC